MATESKQFASREEARKAGYFSRRHQTAKEHDEARKIPSRFNPVSKTMRRLSAEKRQAARNLLTDKMQLAKLDLMLGEGKGAKRERAKLEKRIKLASEKAAKPETAKQQQTKKNEEKFVREMKNLGLLKKPGKKA
jgi:hypothetical protein